MYVCATRKDRGFSTDIQIERSVCMSVLTVRVRLIVNIYYLNYLMLLNLCLHDMFLILPNINVSISDLILKSHSDKARAIMVRKDTTH